MKPFVLTAMCGGGGSWYFTTVLRNAGLDVEHEAYGADGIVGWQCMFPGSGTYLWSEEAAAGRQSVRLHLYRHPLRNLESLEARFAASPYTFFRPSTRDDPGIRSIREQMQWSEDTPPLLLAMQFYLYGHAAPHLSAWSKYRLEDIDSWWHDACDMLQIPRGVAPGMNLATSNSKRHVRQYNDLGWDDLYRCSADIGHRIELIAKEIGYE